MADQQAVSNDRLYQEAMLTFRAVMTASVSTATALFAGSLAAVGFAVDDTSGVNGQLILLAAAPLVAMSVAFIGWWTFNVEAGAAAMAVLPEGSNQPKLHNDLANRPGEFLIAMPLVGAALLVYWGLRVTGEQVGSEWWDFKDAAMVVAGLLIVCVVAYRHRQRYAKKLETRHQPETGIQALTALNAQYEATIKTLTREQTQLQTQIKTLETMQRQN